MSSDERDVIAGALTGAWCDWIADTGCIPDCFTIHGPGTTRVEADFSCGNFAGQVAGWITAVGYQLVPIPRVAQVSYLVSYSLVGSLYPAPGHRREQALTVFDLARGLRPAVTDEEAAGALRDFLDRPRVGDTGIEVHRVTKVTSSSNYEDVTATIRRTS